MVFANANWAYGNIFMQNCLKFLVAMARKLVNKLYELPWWSLKHIFFLIVGKNDMTVRK